MFPDSPYAVPVPSFRYPVEPPGTEPDAPDLVCIQVNRQWLPYIRGSLKQLLLQTTWDVTDPAAINQIQGQVFNLIALFSDDAVCPTGGGAMSFEEENEVVAFREDCNCNLQYLCCDGTWKDLLSSDAVKALISGPSGAGASQPTPGNPACYAGQMPANQHFLIPTPVTTGDKITIKASGAALDPDNGVSDWRCPDGGAYFAGACIGFPYTLGTDPLPSAPHMAVILNLGGTFYAITLGTPFTVPSGVSNVQPQLQVNDSNITNDSGTLTIDACVEKAAGSYTHTFNFALSPYNFVPYNDGGGPRAVYVVGHGWQANPAYKPGRISIIWAGAPSSDPGSGQLVLSGAKSDASGPMAIQIGAENQQATGVGPIFPIPGWATGGAGIFIDCAENNANQNVPAFSVYLQSMSLSGTGADPF